MSSRWVIIEERGGCASTGLFLGFLILVIGVFVLFGGFVLLFLLMYSLVSWVSDRIQGPDPEPSLAFWERTKLWAKRVDEVSSEWE